MAIWMFLLACCWPVSSARPLPDSSTTSSCPFVERCSSLLNEVMAETDPCNYIEACLQAQGACSVRQRGADYQCSGLTVVCQDLVGRNISSLLCGRDPVVRDTTVAGPGGSAESSSTTTTERGGGSSSSTTQASSGRGDGNHSDGTSDSSTSTQSSTTEENASSRGTSESGTKGGEGNQGANGAGQDGGHAPLPAPPHPDDFTSLPWIVTFTLAGITGVLCIVILCRWGGVRCYHGLIGLFAERSFFREGEFRRIRPRCSCGAACTRFFSTLRTVRKTNKIDRLMEQLEVACRDTQVVFYISTKHDATLLTIHRLIGDARQEMAKAAAKYRVTASGPMGQSPMQRSSSRFSLDAVGSVTPIVKSGTSAGGPFSGGVANQNYDMTTPFPPVAEADGEEMQTMGGATGGENPSGA